MGFKDRLNKLPFRKSFSSSTSFSSTFSPTNSTSSTPLQMPLAPGDQPPSSPPDYKVSPLEIRELNELIRKRYALDVEIYNRKNCMTHNRPIVYDRMKRADVVYSKIMATVRLWDREEVWESSDDWDRLKAIRQRLENEEGRRTWEGNPPW